MLSFENTDEISLKMPYISEIYPFYRVVNPFTKEILMFKGKNGNVPIEGPCHEIWKTGKICDNCISVRAINEKKIVLKMGYKDIGLYIVTAVPIEIGGERRVLELIQDVTDGMYLDVPDSDKTRSYTELQKLTKELSLQFDDLIAKDKLTKLFNRRYIEERLPADLASACLNKQPLSVIFADLDDFKKVNDTYGHLVGDTVLYQFAQRILANLRKEDSWAARYGGEEFLVCLTGSGIEEARIVAERLRQAVCESPFVSDNLSIAMTCSFGVHAVCEKACATNMNVFLEQADKNLYIAKNKGKNRVIG